jgi:C_GCAxxG_C_C family probable redox protein
MRAIVLRRLVAMSHSKLLEKIGKMSDLEKKQIIQKIGQSADEYEKLYGGCARNTLRALQEHLGIGGSDVLKAATPFAAGTCRGEELCAALIGGIMAIGLAYASGEPEQGDATSRPLCVGSPSYEKSRQLTVKLCQRFSQQFGGLACQDVMNKVFGKSWNLNEPAVRAEFVQPQVHDRCGEVTREAARLAAEVILGLV